MEVTKESLQNKFKNMETDDLIKKLSMGLTDLAKEALHDELDNSNVSIEEVVKKIEQKKIAAKAKKIDSIELPVTWDRAFRIWLSFVLKNFLSVIVSLIVGFILTYLITIILSWTAGKDPKEMFATVFGATWGITMLVINVWVIKSLLGKVYGDFKLVLIKQPKKH